MNKVILMGRLTRDPEVRYSTSGDNQLAIARYTLAVDRRFRRDEEQTADFIRCVAFGRAGEFAESKAASDANAGASMPKPAGGNAPEAPTVDEGDGFNSIPDSVDDSGLPFNFNY